MNTRLGGRTWPISFWSPLPTWVLQDSRVLYRCLSICWGCACRARSLVFESACYCYPSTSGRINSGRFIGVLPIGDLSGSTKVAGINQYKKPLPRVTVLTFCYWAVEQISMSVGFIPKQDEYSPGWWVIFPSFLSRYVTVFCLLAINTSHSCCFSLHVNIFSASFQAAIPTIRRWKRSV